MKRWACVGLAAWLLWAPVAVNAAGDEGAAETNGEADFESSVSAMEKRTGLLTFYVDAAENRVWLELPAGASGTIGEFIYVEGGHLLALEDSLSYRLEPIYDSTYQKKVDTVKIFGKGSLAMSTSIEPLTMRVNQDYPLSISSSALVAWTGNLIPTVLDDGSLEDVMIDHEETGFKIRFEGDGIVVSEQ